MVGISGARFVRSLTLLPRPQPFPRERPARVRGAHRASDGENGMPMLQSPMPSEALMSMRWSYLILVARPSRVSPGSSHRGPPTGAPDDHAGAPGIGTILAFPRSTRIWAIVFGSVTTSSFFSWYVVSIPAQGGGSSGTGRVRWSLWL